MKSVLYIFFGALFTAASSWALGSLLFHRLGVKLQRGERSPLAFVAGSACLSLMVFLLCAIHAVYKPVFLVVGLAVLAWTIPTGAHRAPDAPNPAAVPRFWMAIFAGVFCVYAVLYFFYAMAPEMSPDGTAYHLAYPARYYRAHGFQRITWDLYANFTQGIELLYLFAFAFGRHSAAVMVHFLYLICLPWLMLSYARRFGFPVAGVAGALFVFLSPVVGIDGTSGYIDVALAAVVFALFYLLQIWNAERDAKLLPMIGILAGFAFAVKYTGCVAIPYVLGFIAWKLWRARAPLRRALVATAVPALLMALPWVVKNWIVVQDPVSPFATRLFPNPYVHVSFEEFYTAYFRHYSLTSYAQIPLEAAVRGQVLNGLTGPLFLLAPLALFALKWRQGRQVLLAAAVFGSTYFSNIGTRFLIPVLPFIALGLAMAVANFRSVVLLLLAVDAVISWPSVVPRYSAQYAWRLEERVPSKAALRRRPEGDYLTEKCPGYTVAQMLDQDVPKGEKIFAFNPTANSYTSHDVLVRYESAPNEVLGDMLYTGLFPDFQPNLVRAYQFPERQVRRIRVVQTARANGVHWTVAEMRVFDRGKELARDTGWRLRANPNPWGVQLAFDNSPVTRWDSWETAAPGMFLEIDFGRACDIDEVRVESVDERQIEMRVEGMDVSSTWNPVPARLSQSRRAFAGGLRQAAMVELKARGIRYLLIDHNDAGADDFYNYARYWGLTLVDQRWAGRLYRIN